MHITVYQQEDIRDRAPQEKAQSSRIETFVAEHNHNSYLSSLIQDSFCASKAAPSKDTLAAYHLLANELDTRVLPSLLDSIKHKQEKLDKEFTIPEDAVLKYNDMMNIDDFKVLFSNRAMERKVAPPKEIAQPQQNSVPEPAKPQRRIPPTLPQTNTRKVEAPIKVDDEDEEDEEQEEKPISGFQTAKQALIKNSKNKNIINELESSSRATNKPVTNGYGNQPYHPARSIPISGVNPTLAKKAPTRDTNTSNAPAPQNKRKFQTPWKDDGTKKEEKEPKKRRVDTSGEKSNVKPQMYNLFEDGEIPEELGHCDPKLIEMIASEVINRDVATKWDDIAGLQHAKKAVQEAVIWPMLRPDIFHGIRAPPKGLLLFGPPGTGKTLIGKAIACESKATFFSISASSLVSKWVGEGERLVKTLFAVARYLSPSVIFVDEIDSMLSARSDSDSDNGTRRLKTEFLVQIDGVGTDGDNSRVLLVGATNRPEELDEAVRRRLVKRLYIPLPVPEARRTIVENLLGKSSGFDISSEDMDKIISLTEGFSGSDMSSLTKEAALGPIRDLHDIMNIDAQSVRKIELQDFTAALDQIRPSVSEKEIGRYLEWNEQFGSFDKVTN